MQNKTVERWDKVLNELHEIMEPWHVANMDNIPCDNIMKGLEKGRSDLRYFHTDKLSPSVKTKLYELKSFKKLKSLKEDFRGKPDEDFMIQVGTYVINCLKK